MPGGHVSDARLKRHYLLVMVLEAIFVALLWLFSRTFA
jgi:hypothetical protein